jgi:hypothetical protein
LVLPPLQIAADVLTRNPSTGWWWLARRNALPREVREMKLGASGFSYQEIVGTVDRERSSQVIVVAPSFHRHACAS